MPKYDLDEYHEFFPPKVGVILKIDCTHTEAQTIKNAPGLPEVAGALAFESGGGLIGAAIVAGLVYAVQGEIGEKDTGDGVVVAIDRRVLPIPTTSVSVHTKPKPAPAPSVTPPARPPDVIEGGLRGIGNRRDR